MDYERYELPNGFRILVAPMPHLRSVSTVLLVGVGSRYESDREAGSAHLVEHLFFKGTRRRPSSRLISEPIERVGGIMNASTDKEATVFWTKTAAEHLELSLDLLSDMILESRLTPRDLGREKSIIVEELAMSRDDPQDWVHTLIDESMWPGHPIGRDVGGSPESVVALDRASVRRFIGSHYAPNNTLLAVAGGIDPERIRKLGERYFGDWTGYISPHFEPAPPTAPPNRMADERPTEQIHICLAFPGQPRTSPDRFALDLLVSILGGGPTSRLFLEVRERLGLTYDVHAYTTRYADAGSVVVYAGVDPSRASEALNAILTEIERLRKRSISREELSKTTEYMKGRMYLSLEDSHSVTSWLGSQELLLDSIMSPDELAATIERVQPREIRDQAIELLDQGRMHVAAVGPNAQSLCDVALP